MNINELESKRDELIKQLFHVKRQIRDEELRNISEEFGVNIGSIVKARDGKEYKVTDIDVNWKRPWLKGNLRKKNKEFGKAERHICGDWELIHS